MKRLSFFFTCLLFFGCPDSGTGPDSADHLLRAFFSPTSGEKRYDWTHLDMRAGVADSLYSVAYIGSDVKFSVDSLSPVSLFQFSTIVSGATHTYQNEYYISDSLVIGYGLSAASRKERIVLLKDTMEVGRIWKAASTYQTSDGVPATIDAAIEQYYTSIHIGNKDYSDVYRITYYPKPSDTTKDAAYATGARHVHYYAKGIGKVLEIVYAPDSTLIWKNELVQEH